MPQDDGGFTALSLFRYHWHNGGRLLLFMASFTILSLLFAVAVWVSTMLWTPEGPFAPLSISDVTINSRVDGVEGPATHVGGVYNGTLVICNDDDQVHTITFVIQFERLTGPIHFVSGGVPVEFPVEPGCATLTGDSAPLPEQVTSGLWREASSASVQRSDQKQTISFVSEPFEVVP